MPGYEYRAMWDRGEPRSDWQEIDPAAAPGHWMFVVANDPDTYIERRSVGAPERVMFTERGGIGTPYENVCPASCPLAKPCENVRICTCGVDNRPSRTTTPKDG